MFLESIALSISFKISLCLEQLSHQGTTSSRYIKRQVTKATLFILHVTLPVDWELASQQTTIWPRLSITYNLSTGVKPFIVLQSGSHMLTQEGRVIVAASKTISDSTDRQITDRKLNERQAVFALV